MSNNSKSKKNDININNFIKIILIGESSVGKTSLISTYNGKKFEENTVTTLNFSSKKKEITIDDIKYKVEIWDTAGQERYRSVSQIFIKGSQIVIFVYDITKLDSFSQLSFWVNYIKELISSDAVFGVVGNKIDLFEEKEEIVEEEEGRKFAKDIGALFTETSAKENPKAFSDFINELLKKFISNRKETEKEWNRVSLMPNNNNNKKRHFC